MAGRNANESWTPEKKNAFLIALVENGGNITAACEETETPRSTVYYTEKEDEEFASMFRQAQRHGLEVLEDEARRRAFKGVEKPVFHQGIQCGKIKEYSDTLTIFLLKGGMPEKYREKASFEHSSPDGSMTPKPAFDLSHMGADELIKVIKALPQETKE